FRSQGKVDKLCQNGSNDCPKPGRTEFLRSTAVRSNSGQTVSHSVPGLAVGPTLPPKTGRNPGARPPVLPAAGGYTCQPKSVPGVRGGKPRRELRARIARLERSAVAARRFGIDPRAVHRV